MKKLYSLLAIVIFSLLATGCSSSSSSDEPTTGGEDPTPIVNCSPDDNITNGFCNDKGNIECNSGFSLDALTEQCTEDDIITPTECEAGSIIENGTCTEAGVIVCDSGFEKENGVCIEIVIPTECEAGSTIENGICTEDGVIECNDNFTKENGLCVADEVSCAIDEVLNEETNLCEKDESITAVVSGTVRDGLISGATVSACKVANSEKTEANSTCSNTDNSGQFSCAIRETEYDYLIFKAVGGKDLGENVSDSRDDRDNPDTLKSVLTKTEVENNVSSFVSPATTLVVLNASTNSWDIESAKTSVASALGTISGDLFDSLNGVKSATAVANIIDSLGDVNRSEIFTTLSTESSIYSDGVTTGLLTKLNSEISSEAEAVLSTLVKNSVDTPSDITEKVINQLSDRVDNGDEISEDMATNFSEILADNYTILDDEDVINFVADATEKGVIDGNALEVATTIETVLNTATDKDIAKEILSDAISKGDSLTDSETILSEIAIEIVKNSCADGQIYDDESGICIDKPEAVKDAVNTPDDIPGIPNDSAYTVVEDTFPSIPSDNDYSLTDGLSDNPSIQTDNDYPTYEATNGEDNQTTPYVVD